MKVPLRSDARVKSIDPAPPIRSGQGNVVTGRFIHQAANCIDLHVEGQDNPIGCTDNHPFWSADRQEFIPAGKLLDGERVLLYNGDTARITQKLPRPGPETVYNLEIWGEHVYCVGNDGVLVHNKGINSSNNANKLNYLFGKATGNQHNIDRSLSMLQQMERIGLSDTPANRNYVLNHLKNVSKNPSNIVEVNASRQTRESLLMGPNGGVKLVTIWDGDKLITIKVIGKGSRYHH